MFFNENKHFWLRVCTAAVASVAIMALAALAGYVTAGFALRGHQSLNPSLIRREAIGTGLLAVIGIGHEVAAFAMFYIGKVMFPNRHSALNQRAPLVYFSMGTFMALIGLLYILSSVRIWYPNLVTAAIAWTFLASGAASLFISITFPDILSLVKHTVKIVQESERKDAEIKDLIDQARLMAEQLEALKTTGDA